MTPAGSVTTFYSFGTVAGDGASPGASLVQSPDGSLYGTTFAGGVNGTGTLFRISLSGTLTTLAPFSGSEGANPLGNMILASDGNLYGTTSSKGYTNYGSVFKYFLTPTPPQAPSITKDGVVPVYSSVPTIQQGEWISIYGSNLSGTATVWNGDFPLSLGGTNVEINGTPAYIWFVSPTQINVQVPNLTATGSVPVTVTTAGGAATSTVTIAAIAPMFSLLDSSHVAGIILRSDGSGAYGSGTYDIVGPTGSSLGYRTAAAKAGDTVSLFGVGFGPTKPKRYPPDSLFSGSAPATSAGDAAHQQPIHLPRCTRGKQAPGYFRSTSKYRTGWAGATFRCRQSSAEFSTPTGVVISLQ